MTVLGVTGEGESEVVFVPGVVSVGPAFERLEPRTGAPTRFGMSTDFGGQVFAGPVGRKLGELMIGDVLVCHGSLEPGAVVQLSNADGHAWVPGLRVPYRHEIFDEPLRG